MLLWDQYSGLAWILQPSSCSEMWKHGDTEVMERMRDVLGGGGLTSLMSSSSSAGLQSMSMSPQLAVAAMAITVLLPSEGRGGQGGWFNGHWWDGQATCWSGDEDGTNSLFCSSSGTMR